MRSAYGGSVVGPEPFGSTPDGTPVHRWVLDDGRLAIAVLDLGATVQALHVPDGAGERADVVLGFDEPAGYLDPPVTFAGAVVGRYANRIAGGTFELDGARHRVPVNDRGNALHGGPDGYHRRTWQVEPAGTGALRCRLTSPDGDQGFPGRLDVEVTYTLPGNGRVVIEYRAACDRPTVVNLTQHTYFALDGLDVLNRHHLLQVHADRYTPLTRDLIPTGELAPVEGTPFDLREPRPVADVVAALARRDPAAGHLDGVDHNFVVGDPAPQVRPVCALTGGGSGRRLEVASTEPGVQVYTAGTMRGPWIGKGGRPIRPCAGVALETQHFPDSPNRPGFPSTRLDPGRQLHSRTEWQFS